jgi:hypothetical protein
MTITKHSYLEKLFTNYGTDKGIWGYTPAYEKHLFKVRHDVAAVLEIGICGFRDIPNNVVGASLFAWRDYFPGAEICGIDNDARFIFNDQHRIHTALANAYHPVSLNHAVNNLLQKTGDMKFDFICDDAVHDPMPQMQLVRQLWPLLCRNGKYAIEEACPYKVPNGDLFEAMIKPLMLEHEDMVAEEFTTPKEERLIILTKL